MEIYTTLKYMYIHTYLFIYIYLCMADIFLEKVGMKRRMGYFENKKLCHKLYKFEQGTHVMCRLSLSSYLFTCETFRFSERERKKAVIYIFFSPQVYYKYTYYIAFIWSTGVVVDGYARNVCKVFV